MPTSCKDCVFRTNNTDLVQIGCRFGRLDKLPHEVVDNHFVINSFCNLCRDYVWGDSSQTARAREEVRVKIALVVIVSPETDLQEVVGSIMAQSIKPVEVIFSTRKFARSDDIRAAVSNKGIKWKIKNCLEEDANAARLVDIAVSDINGVELYVVLEGPLPKEFISSLEYFVNDRCGRIYYAEGPISGSSHLVTVNVKVHQIFGGFALAEYPDGTKTTSLSKKIISSGNEDKVCQIVEALGLDL